VDLRRRIASTRWPEPERSPMRRKACSSPPCRSSRPIGDPITTGASARPKLNALLMFVTRIDGLDIQFIHVRSKNRDTSAACSSFRWQRG